MQAKNFKHEYEVAEALGFKRVAFSERKKRNSPPIAEIELFCHKEFLNPDFVFNNQGETFVVEAKIQPQTIAEQIGPGYGPEVKLVADYLEVKIKGKTAEERLRVVEEIMADIRNKYK